MVAVTATPYVTAVQVSDSHLFASTQTCLLGMPTQYSLEHVLECIRTEQPNIDMVLCTGIFHKMHRRRPISVLRSRSPL